MTDPDQTRPFAALPKPEGDDAAGDEPRGRRALIALPDGALGIFFLVILAALSGGLIAVYWPWVQSGSDNSTTNDRLTTIETRVAQIAAGHGSSAAAAAYGDQQRNLAALKMRLDADEARLTAMEKASGEIDGSDLSALKTDIDKDAAGIAQLNGRVAKLEQTPASSSAQALAQLRKDLDMRTQSQADANGRISERVAALEKNAPPADLAARLDSFALKTGEDALDLRLTKLESHDASEVMRRAASLLALADLVRADSGTESFVTELSALRALAPAAPELADLSKYAAAGVPTRAILGERFSAQADSILAAERAGNAKTWSQRLWVNLSNLVSIRRVGDVSGDNSESRVARAEAALHSGDLDRAVRETAALKGPARIAAQPWLASAQARLAVDRDTRALMSRVVASLSAPPDSHS